MWFEALSGLKINLEKSKLILVGRVTYADLLADELGCKVGNLLSSYLGIPLGARFNFETVWDRVEEGFRKRLVIWKRQYIFKGGKDHPNQKYFIEPSSLSHIYPPFA